MSGKSMDVFSLRDTVVGEYQKFATSFTTIHAEDIRQQVEAIYAEGRFWPEPLIQINPSYKKAHGEYRTKRVILEIYDAMSEAARTGTPYQSRLDPPPADPRVAHKGTRPAAEKKGAR
jgi:hypothetical protein